MRCINHPYIPKLLVSDSGDIFSIATQSGGVRTNPFKLATKKDKDGYLCLAIGRSGKMIYARVHRLVAETFIDNPSNLPIVNHLDGNILNNHVSNLEWCTVARNTKHAHDIGLISQKHEHNNGSKLTQSDVVKIRSMIRDGVSQGKIAKIFQVTQPTISCVARGVTWV